MHAHLVEKERMKGCPVYCQPSCLQGEKYIHNEDTGDKLVLFSVRVSFHDLLLNAIGGVCL